MEPGSTLSGEAPRTATTVEAATFPAVKGGRADYLALTKGGLFTLVANARKPLVIEAIDNPSTATITLIDRNTQSLSRTVPAATPFVVSANEVIKVSGGSAGSYVGILYRIDGEKIL
jgi:hypothetical protein